MTKLKAPLISFKATGTLGDSLTFQKRGSQTMARKKPHPTDPYTLFQAYHRWDYIDYANLWHALTPAQKQQWNTNARPFRITGFNLFMRTNLNTLPDLAGRWHMDSITAGQTPDSSKNIHHATVYGASLTSGQISNALSFDGKDDYISCGIYPIHSPANAITLEIRIFPIYLPSYSSIFDKRLTNWATFYHGYRLFIGPQKQLVFRFSNGPYPPASLETAQNLILLQTWSHVAVTYDRIQAKCYLNGTLVKTVNETRAISDSSTALLLHGEYLYAGLLDEAIIYSRALTPQEIKRHSERKYPA